MIRIGREPGAFTLGRRPSHHARRRSITRLQHPTPLPGTRGPRNRPSSAREPEPGRHTRWDPHPSLSERSGDIPRGAGNGGDGQIGRAPLGRRPGSTACRSSSGRRPAGKCGATAGLQDGSASIVRANTPLCSFGIQAGTSPPLPNRSTNQRAVAFRGPTYELV